MFREAFITNKIKAKKVLDVGSVGQTDAYCLWDVLLNNAGELVGVDLPPNEREVLQSGKTKIEKDDRIIYGNMETLSLGKIFDVVVAGDIIEHVSNQGLFLDNIRRHLHPDGELIITTPNAKWPTVFLKPNPTHTMWHDIHTLTYLLNKHGYEVVYKKYYFGNKPYYGYLKRLLAWRQGLLVVAKPK